MKHTTTSTESEMFHQLGYLRHTLSNTDLKRSTDRGISTDSRSSHDLGVNTEPKITYSKNVGNDERIEESSWKTTSQRSRTFESGFQTDLVDTKRRVGYLDQESKVVDEEAIEEQRQEVITFRVPLETRTEEIYETTVTTETKQKNRQIIEIRNQSNANNKETTLMKSETTERTRPVGTLTERKPRRSQSPEELVEESYEILSTLVKPRDGKFLITSTSPRTTVIQKYPDASPNKFQSSEDDSSYCEEWTVTEAKRKKDGQTVQTIIDR